MGALKQHNVVLPVLGQKRHIESKNPFEIKGGKRKERSEGAK
jgi:hypothetical protein